MRSWLNIIIKRTFHLGFLKENKNVSQVSKIIKNSKSLIIENRKLDEPKILIIGAGISGLSAAEHLIQNGLKNVQIMEASLRTGGRINSVQFGDTICELGAKWINETDSENSIHKIISNNDFLREDIKRHEKNYLTSDSNFVDTDLSYFIALAFSNILNKPIASEKFQNNSKIYLQMEIDNIIKEKFKNIDDDIVQKTFLSHTNHLSGFFGTDLSVIHTSYLKEIVRIFTKPIFMPSGMSKIIEYLVTKIGRDRIMLGMPVGTIQWANFQSFDGALVYCIDGSIYFANHVICTLPLGTIKTLHHILFNPLLPESKLYALFGLDCGYPIKIYLRYEDNIYNWLSKDIRLIWKTDESNNRLDWSTNITEILPVSNSKNVIEIKISGATGDIVERLSDDAIKKGVTKVLKRFLNNYNIPFPEEVLRSNWNADVKYFGGMPFLSTLSERNQINQLASPIYSVRNPKHPVLLFAGDATISDGFGTLDGARKSGIREAMRIVNLYKNLL